MNLFPSASACPYCQKTIDLKTLKKKPFSGHLAWYQLTPRPKTLCPFCEGEVRHSVENSTWLVLPAAALLILIASLFLTVKLPLYVQVACVVIALTGLHMGMKHGRFIPVSSTLR